MITCQSIDELRAAVREARANGHRIGCVPTMGALHAGHMSLVEHARSECGCVVATIFVNPTQFGPGEDFDRYPRPLSADLERCREAGVDIVFHPEVSAIYPAGDATVVEVPGLSTILEGAHRPGHFNGVSTIVLKLFNIVLPDAAFFGQKDFQQQLLIRRMVDDLNVPVTVRTCPIIRDADGLALSSRNVYLSADERETALSISQSLRLAHDLCVNRRVRAAEAAAAMREKLNGTAGLQLDYAIIADPDTLEELVDSQPRMVGLVAARVGRTRLIDNMLIQS